MPMMLVVSGLYEGAGLSALLLAVYPNLGVAGDFLPAAALVLAALGVFLWRRYVLTAKEQGIGPASRAILFRATMPILIVAYVLPAILFVTLLIWPASPPLILGMAGISVLAGGFIWKAIVITRACHQQGFALAKYPQRGSGTYAAPLMG